MIDTGSLAGLSDARRAKAIDAVHKHPETSLVAGRAGSFRWCVAGAFCCLFRQVVGIYTPFDYLTNWQIAVAQTMLREGKSLKRIAPSVGYANPRR